MAERADKSLPQEMASAVNLMGHPLAGAAALSAIGFGVASQALGLWMGTLAGAAEASERLLRSVSEAGEGGRVPAKVRARARSMMEEAQSLAREVAEPAARSSIAPALKKPEAGRAKAAASIVAPAPAVAKAESRAAGSRKPQALERPSVPDDLKAISGIGPKLEQVLNGLGIWTYAQVAGWSADEIAWVDEHLGFNGRIGRDGWTGQAAELADRSAKQ